MTESEEMEYRERIAEQVNNLSEIINAPEVLHKMLIPTLDMGEMLAELKDKETTTSLKLVQQYAMTIMSLYTVASKLSVTDLSEDTFFLIESTIKGLDLIRLSKDDLQRADKAAELKTRMQN